MAQFLEVHVYINDSGGCRFSSLATYSSLDHVVVTQFLCLAIVARRSQRLWIWLLLQFAIDALNQRTFGYLHFALLLFAHA